MPEPTEREVAETNRLPTAGPQPVYGFDDITDTFEPVYSTANALHVRVVASGAGSSTPTTETTLLEVRNGVLALGTNTDGIEGLLTAQARLVDTQPVSAASLPLPTGAATSANQTVNTAAISAGNSLAALLIRAPYESRPLGASQWTAASNTTYQAGTRPTAAVSLSGMFNVIPAGRCWVVTGVTISTDQALYAQVLFGENTGSGGAGLASNGQYNLSCQVPANVPMHLPMPGGAMILREGMQTSITLFPQSTATAPFATCTVHGYDFTNDLRFDAGKVILGVGHSIMHSIPVTDGSYVAGESLYLMQIRDRLKNPVAAGGKAASLRVINKAFGRGGAVSTLTAGFRAATLTTSPTIYWFTLRA